MRSTKTLTHRHVLVDEAVLQRNAHLVMQAHDTALYDRATESNSIRCRVSRNAESTFKHVLLRKVADRAAGRSRLGTAFEWTQSYVKSPESTCYVSVGLVHSRICPAGSSAHDCTPQHLHFQFNFEWVQMSQPNGSKKIDREYSPSLHEVRMQCSSKPSQQSGWSSTPFDMTGGSTAVLAFESTG